MAAGQAQCLRCRNTCCSIQSSLWYKSDMDEYLITLRIIHLLSGIFWVGTSIFIFFFLEPAVSKSGPAGGQVMGALASSKMPLTMMSASALAILSGGLLYWRNSSGFDMEWISSGPGTAFTIGGLAALIAFIEGLVVHMPLQIKMKKLGDAIRAGGGAPSPEQQEQAKALQGKLKHAAMWSVILLVITVVGMAVARYVG